MGRLLITFLLSVIGLMSGLTFLWKVPLIEKNRPSFKRRLKVSVIIPARNEEQSLPQLLSSLKDQNFPIEEIIVVDDDSTDRTLEVAEEFGIQVISEFEHTGKSAACWAGAKQAKGDYLVFLDADTFFVGSDALEKALSTYRQEMKTGLLSIQPYHVIKQFYETLAIVPNIVVMAGLNRFSLFQNLPKRGAFGPFILVNKEEYESVGGHGAILDSHMDDIELAKLYKTHHLPVEVFGGQESIHFRMFPEGVKQLLNGITKSLIHGSKGTHAVTLIAIGLWLLSTILPIVLFVLASIQEAILFIFLSIIMYGVGCLHFRWLMNKVGRFPWQTALVPFFYVLSFLVIYAWALIQVYILKKVSWRGRVHKV
ncbi:4,4'-diaponeurosporenoate glycosyltransferase [Alkalibacterium iburiense]|uniref:4,4'-diaponeurosporenoate glycosyltransferase n=1 Tax=Alkalibacterium iburiense TaxID=290589 RepID=A0ABN0X4L9_9LACT